MGFISPASGVTMPCRSASASFPVRMSYSSRRATSEAIADGEDGSIRIFSSQSSVMNRQVGSTSGFTTVRSSPWTSAMSCQYSTDAPPSGSAPIRTPALRIASTSMMFARSRTYASRKSYWPSASPSRSLNGVRSTPSRPASMSAFARSAIQPVASVSAGPPFGGLYLNPPSRGGLCEG